MELSKKDHIMGETEVPLIGHYKAVSVIMSFIPDTESLWRRLHK